MNVPPGAPVRRWRLSLLMFLMYAPAGILLPTLSRCLQQHNFTHLEIALASATQALAALLTPFMAGQIADRWFPAERVLAVYALAAGVLLWLLAEQVDSPLAFFLVLQAFWLVMGPGLTLGTSTCFAHLANAERDYGHVRMWGTVGWVTASWLLALWLWFGHVAGVVEAIGWWRPGAPLANLADAQRLGGLLAFALGGYVLTLPSTPPQRPSRRRFAPLAALHLLRDPSFLVYFVCLTGVCVTVPFTSQLTPLLLTHLGVTERWLPVTLTIAQSLEIVSLGLLPMILLRFNLRGTMLLGLSAWLLALALLTVGGPLWLVVASQGLNGLCISCFLVAGQMFANGKARGDVRVSAQALLAFVSGLGMLIGHLLVGLVRVWTDGSFAASYAVAAAVVSVLLLLFFLGFHGGTAAVPPQDAVPLTDPQQA